MLKLQFYGFNNVTSLLIILTTMPYINLIYSLCIPVRYKKINLCNDRQIKLRNIKTDGLIFVSVEQLDLANSIQFVA